MAKLVIITDEKSCEASSYIRDLINLYCKAYKRVVGISQEHLKIIITGEKQTLEFIKNMILSDLSQLVIIQEHIGPMYKSLQKAHITKE